MIISLWGARDRPSSESAHLPPMWPGFKSRHRAICGLSFVVGSLPCSERFFSGYSGFPPGFPLCGCATSKSLFIYFFRYRTHQSAGLNADFNFIFSKSARACDVSFCFDFYLNVTRAFFSCFKPLWKRVHPRNVWFFRAFSTLILIDFTNTLAPQFHAWKTNNMVTR